MAAVIATTAMSARADGPPVAVAAATESSDPEFEKLLSIKRLQNAWQDLDAAQLTDIVVDFYVAERILGRPHATISVDEVLATALRVAVENRDEETIQRIREIATGRKNEVILLQLQLAAPSRAASSDDWYAVPEMTPERFRLYVEVRNLLKVALAAGDPGLLKDAREMVAKSTILTPVQQADLLEKIEGTRSEMPEEVDPASAALSMLAGPSRGDRGEAIIDAWDSLSPAQQAQVIAAGLDVRKLKQSYGRSDRQPERNAPPVGTSWTLMLYLAADSDLERAIMDNLEELLRVGPPPGVKVVVLADRSPYDDNDNPADDGEEEEEGEKEENQKRRTNREIANAGDWSDAKIFEVQKDNLILLKDLGEVNTGDGQVLTEFLEFASTKYPAEHLGLILSGHGDAWQVGLCPDESAEETEDKAALHIVELRDAIQQGVGRPLDLVAFDCCLMANFEVYQALSKVTLAIAASEEVSPGPGWNYPALMRNLSKNPRASGLEIGVAMGEGFADYFAKYRGYDWYDKTTFSVVDMQRWTPVEAALHRVSKGLSVFLTKDIDDTWSRIARAASNTREYSKGEGALLDLKHLADNLGAEFDNPALRGELEKLTQAIGQAVVFNYCGKQQVNSHGVTIYLPHRVFRFTLSDGSKGDAVDFEEWFEQYASLPLAESRHGWFPLVEQASRLAQMSRSTAMLGELESELDDDVLELSVKVLDVNNFDYAQFVLARNDEDSTLVLGVSNIDPFYTELLEPDENGSLSGGWDGTWFTLGMGKQSMLCAEVTIDDSDEEAQYVIVTAQVARAGEKRWQDIQIAFLEEDTDEWSFSNALLVGDKSQEFELSKGDRLRSVRLLIDDKGEELVADDQSIRIGNPDGLSLTLEKIPPGNYEIGFKGVDTTGNAEFVGLELED